MRRVVLCLALIFVPSLAHAGGWVVQKEDDEGGPVTVASVTADPVGKITPGLRLMCAGDKGVMLRYDMASDDGQPGSAADFLFENEVTQDRLHMAYEEMDGAFAAYFPKADPIVTLLETGSDVFVSESSGNYPAQTFPLQGSSKAIGAVVKDCK